MPYHNAQFICGCGEIFSFNTMSTDTNWYRVCSKCETTIIVEMRIPQKLFLQDAVQRVEYEAIHGKVK